MRVAGAKSGERPGGKVGLIAGAGSLPGEARRILAANGLACELFAFDGVSEADRCGAPACDPAAPETDATLAEGLAADHRMPLGQLEALVAKLRTRGIERLLVVGKFSKERLLAEPERLAPDAEARRLLASLDGWGDDALTAALAGWLESHGLEICRQDDLLAPLLAPRGRIATREPGDGERRDAAVGWAALAKRPRATTGSDTAQAVAVHDGVVVAVEAADGTDALIRRAAHHVSGATTIVKAARPGQDRRFDLPAVGPATIASMRRAGASALAVEAGATLVVARESFARAADAAGIAVWGFVADTEAP